MLLRTCNTDFDNRVISFTDLNGRLSEIEDKVDLTLVCNTKYLIRNTTMWYSIEPRIRIYLNEFWFLLFARNLSDRFRKTLIDTASKTGLDGANYVLKKKIVKQTGEAPGELIGNEIVEKIVKPKPAPEAKPRHVKGMFIPPKQRPETVNDLRLLQNGTSKNI